MSTIDAREEPGDSNQDGPESRLERIMALFRHDVVCTGIGFLVGAGGGIVVGEELHDYVDGLREAPLALRIALDTGSAFLYGGFGAVAGFAAANLYGIYRLRR